MKIARLGLIVAAVALTVLSTGCATFMSGATQSITIRSAPPGAHVQFGDQSGTTPVVMQIPKGEVDPIEVTFGRYRQVITLNKKGNAFLNFSPLRWPGLLFDAMSGAKAEQEPEEIFVDFKKVRMVRYAR